ncbi:MAG: hypothetical protein R3D71_01145 [Rickettsiales bacterium]
MVGVNHRVPQQQSGGVFVDGSGGAHVMGEQLREVDAPVEGLVGAAKGLVNGLVLGGAGSAVITAVDTPEGQKAGRAIIQNMKSSHLGAILGVALATSALSGFIRYSRAAKQNEWSRKHYGFLESQIDSRRLGQAQSFAQREDERKNDTQDRGIS